MRKNLLPSFSFFFFLKRQLNIGPTINDFIFLAGAFENVLVIKQEKRNTKKERWKEELCGGLLEVHKVIKVERKGDDGSSRRERADTVGETFEIDSRGDEVLYLQK